MKNIFISFLATLFFLSFDSIAQSNPQVNGRAAFVRDIKIQGVSKVTDTSIKKLLLTKKGELLNRLNVSRDIKELYSLKQFEKIEVKYEPSTETLIYVLDERPAINQVILKGNDEISESKLKEILLPKDRRFFDEASILNAIYQAKLFYESQGFTGTEIEYEKKDAKNGAVDIVYNIDEGEEIKIRDIKIEGNDNLSDREITDVLVSSEYSWVSSWATGGGRYRKIALEVDVNEIKQLYLNNGYAQVEVLDPEVIEIENGVKLVFKVKEGDKYEIGDIRISGDRLKRVDELMSDLPLQKGDTFSVSKLRDTVTFINSEYGSLGYVFSATDPQTYLNDSNNTVDVDFQVDSGEKFYIRNILIRGNDKTRQNVIRRDLKFEPGDLYSTAKVKRSEQLLNRLGFFNSVNFSNVKADQPNKVDVVVDVEEGPTTNFSLGAGFSSYDSFMVSGRVQDNNFLGTGNSLLVNLNTGRIRSLYLLDFTNPRVFDSYLSAGFRLESSDFQFEDFVRGQKGFSVNTGYPLAFLGEGAEDDIRLSLEYGLYRVDIDDVDEVAPQRIKDEEGDYLLSTITPRFVRNTIDNPLNPTRGSRQIASFEYSVGGDTQFWLLGLANTVYVPLFETEFGDIVVSHRLTYDKGEALSSSDLDTLPLIRRFFPGGINSVRGYEARTLGPSDENGREYGGSQQFVSNIDLIFPLVANISLNGVLFFDAGQAFDDEDSVNFGELKKSIGWGFRWRTPIAPIRIEFGYPLDQEEGDSNFEVHFSFGSPL